MKNTAVVALGTAASEPFKPEDQAMLELKTPLQRWILESQLELLARSRAPRPLEPQPRSVEEQPRSGEAFFSGD